MAKKEREIKGHIIKNPREWETPHKELITNPEYQDLLYTMRDLKLSI